MKLYLRLLWLLLTVRRRPPCPAIGPCETQLRVLPTDLDIFMHVNNGVYLTMMDLGRTDLMLRAGFFHSIRKNGWYPVVAAESIRFRRSLRLWQRFVIQTRVLGWDDTSIYLEQVFKRDDEVIAHAVVDARILARGGGKVSPAQLMQLIDLEDTPPVLPEWVHGWLAATHSMASNVMPIPEHSAL